MAAGSSMGSPSQKGLVPKPRLSFWNIFNLSFGFLGIQFGFALQNGNASRILQVFGADVEELSWFWLVAPITGMIVQPIIGYYSDRTWNKLGRRRPYFLAGAILSAIGLILMPNAGMFTAILPALWVGAGMLMVMDASFNIAMEPFRALVGDKLPDSQRTLGYSVQTGLIGIGAVIGSWLPYILANWFGVRDVADEGKIPDNVIYSFICGAVILLGAIIWTVSTTKEYPPEEQAKYTGTEVNPKNEGGLGDIWKDFKAMPKTMRQLGLVQFFSWFALFSMWVFSTPAITRSKYDMNIPKENLVSVSKLLDTLSAGSKKEDAEKFEKIKKQTADYLTANASNTGSLFVEANYAAFFSKNKIVPEKKLIDDFLTGLKANPVKEDEYEKIVKELEALKVKHADPSDKNDEAIGYNTFIYCVTNIKADPVVSSMMPQLNVVGNMKKVGSEYNKGANWVGILFGIYNGISAIFAFFLPLIAKRIGRKMTHAVALFCGGLGLISIFLINDPNWLIISMAGVGIAWASILAMPYSILAGAIPGNKMGIYMGIFNFFITFPQIVNGIFGGLIVKHIYNNQPIYALVLAGVFMLCAAVSVVYVYDPSPIKVKEETT